MKNIISAVIMIVFVVGGAVAADFLKSSPSSGHASQAASSANDSHHKPEKKGKKSSGHGEGDGHGEPKSKGGKYYYDFSRQFVVPVMEKGKVSALVIMDLNLELDQSDADGVYMLEPKLRDALMRGLLSLSNQGAFSGQMTSPEKYEVVQKELLKAARTVKDEVQNVLILDIARQDQ